MNDPRRKVSLWRACRGPAPPCPLSSRPAVILATILCWRLLWRVLHRHTQASALNSDSKCQVWRSTPLAGSKYTYVLPVSRKGCSLKDGNLFKVHWGMG